MGGTISPEMQTPKLLWLKEHLPAAWQKHDVSWICRIFSTYRATDIDVRSLCSTTCKWTYLGEGAEGGVSGWRDDYFRAIGLGDLVAEGYERIGTNVRPMGERLGTLTPRAAQELGLSPAPLSASPSSTRTPVGSGCSASARRTPNRPQRSYESRLALIGGTSSCHMAVSRDPKFPLGIWGPYYSAMIPGLWLTEGGQSATGSLIEHVIDLHARGAALR